MSKLSKVEQVEIPVISQGDLSNELGNKQNSLMGSSCNFQCKAWVLTWNNYPIDVFEQMSKHLVPLCEKYVFGIQ